MTPRRVCVVLAAVAATAAPSACSSSDGSADRVSTPVGTATSEDPAARSGGDTSLPESMDVSAATTDPAGPAVDQADDGTGTSAPPSTTTVSVPSSLEGNGPQDAVIEGDNGSVSLGQGQLPAGVAASFPVPDDLVVSLSSENGAASGFSGTTQMSFAELIVFYPDGLADAGYDVQPGRLVQDVVAVFSFIGPDGSGQVAISAGPGTAGTDVLVTFES